MIEYSQVATVFCSFSKSMFLTEYHSLTTNTRYLSSAAFKLQHMFTIQAVAERRQWVVLQVGVGRGAKNFSS
jgi:hypothetical protein